jgi:hypothetical protein
MSIEYPTVSVQDFYSYTKSDSVVKVRLLCCSALWLFCTPLVHTVCCLPPSPSATALHFHRSYSFVALAATRHSFTQSFGFLHFHNAEMIFCLILFVVVVQWLTTHHPLTTTNLYFHTKCLGLSLMQLAKQGGCLSTIHSLIDLLHAINFDDYFTLNNSNSNIISSDEL